MRKDSPLANLDYIEPKDLINKPLIISREVPATSEFSKWIKKDINKLNIIATYNLVYNASILVNNGLGYALTLDKLINSDDFSNFRFRPLMPKLETEINIIWKKYQIFSKPAELFLKELEKEVDTSN